MKIKVAPILAFILCSYSFGNPEGSTIIAGDVDIQTDGSNLNITASDRSIIEWQDFSIDAGETTHFFQPSSNAAVLNQVTSNIPSSIYGNLIGNGNVYLMNANGIVIGATGVIDTGGFLATTLDQGSSKFFENGQLELLGDSDAAIVNLGNITATGDIFLVAAKIESPGAIQSISGFVGLAAGKDVLLKESGEERIFIRPVGEGEIDISGIIEALDIEIKSRGNAYSTAINLEGQLTANKVNEVGGRVFLSVDNGDISLGDIAADADVIINADAGGIRMLTGSSIEADEIIKMSASGDIELSKLSSTGGEIFVESGSMITDVSAGDANETNITASTVSLTAEGSIGSIDGSGSVNVDASILTAVNSGGGNILIDEFGSLETLTANSGSITVSADGTLSLVDAPSVTLSSSQSADTLIVDSGSITYTAGGNLSLVSLVDTTSVTVSSSQSSDITLNSPNVVSLNGYDAFEIQMDDQVQFVVPNLNQNIISRVTSPNPSEILGNLTSESGLYLINPTGVTVGNSGAISIGSSSVVLTTGSSGGSQANDFSSGSTGVVLSGNDHYFSSNAASFTIRPIELQPIRIPQTNEQLNSSLFSKFKKGQSNAGSMRSSFMDDDKNTGLIARFSAQASDSSQSIINLNR